MATKHNNVHVASPLPFMPEPSVGQAVHPSYGAAWIPPGPSYGLHSRQRQNPCQAAGHTLRACSSRGCRAKEARHGAAPLRRKVTGDTPRWWAGHDPQARRPVQLRLQGQPTSHPGARAGGALTAHGIRECRARAGGRASCFLRPDSKMSCASSRAVKRAAPGRGTRPRHQGPQTPPRRWQRRQRQHR